MKHRSDYVEIPKSELEELYYGEGLTQKQIAVRFGVTGGTIRNRMIEYGLAARTAQDYVRLDIPKAELERLYVHEQRPTPEVAAIIGCATSAVYNYLRRYEIPIRPGGWDKVKHIVPVERLEWSPEFAYVVGLIASDGSLQANVNEVRLASTDRELTDSYCRCLGLRPDDVPEDQWPEAGAQSVHVRIEHRPPYKKQYHIIFSDFAYRARLEQIGLTPSKSLTLGPLQVPDLYFRDFLRGEFDGDGCWSMDKRLKGGRLLAVFTSGSRSYLEWLRSSIERLAGISKGYIWNIDLRYQGESCRTTGAVSVLRIRHSKPDSQT